VVIAETGRLFIRNLPYTAADDDLRAAFEAYGQVEDAHVVVDKGTRRSKGFAMVQFAAAEDAVAAFTALDGSIFMGRLLHVLPGKRAPEPAPAAEGDGAAAGDGEEGAPRGGGTSSYKRQREGELKASAGNRAAWNSLFMRADTVAEAVAAHYGVTKAELLDPTAADMAVRLALGETHVIAETKAALDQAGVDVAKLEEAAASAARGKGAAAAAAAGRGADAPRSDRVLLVKNLPFSASEGDLEALFGGVGSLARVALPPTRTLALVEFVEAKDAKRAFQSLAYKRFHHVPLYLEWAPAGIFSKPPAPAKPAAAAPAAPAARAAKKEAAKKETAAAAGLGAPAEDDDSVESSSIFVKNLAWATEDAALGAHFAAAAAAAGGALRAATVAKRKTKEGKFLSAGFGFVECSDEGVARAVIAALQGSSLDGHSLVLQLSQAAARGGEAKPAAPLGGAAQETTKVVVRNVAFEATRKDILGLFTPFGHVKSCRLPRKFDGSHRGFAFVDFSTRQEARAAVEAVAGTHLYGRRLVIEWAEADGGLEELRSKTAAKFRGEAVALLSGGGAGGEERGSGGEEGEEEPQQQQPERKKRRRGRD
jgi:multiple RNA-binding domain-containing protein 1